MDEPVGPYVMDISPFLNVKVIFDFLKVKKVTWGISELLTVDYGRIISIKYTLKGPPHSSLMAFAE